MLAPNSFLVFWLRSTGNFLDSDVIILFLDDHNFISHHPPDLKLVINDAPCGLLQSVKTKLSLSFLICYRT